MMKADTHIHDCTGSDLTCACGYVFTVPRFSIHIDVWDRRSPVIDQYFATDAVVSVVTALRAAADRIEQMR